MVLARRVLAGEIAPRRLTASVYEAFGYAAPS
ncbi:hypothetical protein CLV72_107305 [Allonocardiopsis opalescens]|uniref:Uncharacterized protein n=1 Tax=Allonocardiopsis opalescens TaxID=1144618 RepID=A0A2T0PZ31_9ACTN|nr:hypothetical protein CLV72_107305 [Allonocardiopsis opalescens]